MGFVEDYFVKPVLSNGWFNPFNTILYGITLIVGVVFVYKLLEKLKVEPDRKFLLAILPFVIWAPVTRALRDFVYRSLSANPPVNFLTDPAINLGAVYSASLAHIKSTVSIPLFPKFYSAAVTWFVTPGSYLITFLLAFSIFLISVGLQRRFKLPYWKIMFVIGFVILLVSMSALPVKNWQPFYTIISLTVGLTGVFLVLSWIFRNKKSVPSEKLKPFVNYTSSLILGAHFLDASATFVALTQYGFVEQHVIPRLAFGVFGPSSFFVLKAVVVLLVLWAFDKEIENVKLKNFLKICVVILGLAPGARDMISLMV